MVDGRASEPLNDAFSEALTPRHKVWRVNIFAVTWLSYTGYYFCRRVFPIVKHDLRDLMAVTDSDIAHVWTAFLIAYMAGQFMTAWLGRRLACRTLLLFGMFLSAAANLAMGGVTSLESGAYWPLLIFMIVNGLAQGTGWGGNIGVLAHWFRRTERGTVMAFWSTCYMLGSWMAKSFAAFMLGALGIAWSFWGASAILFGVWILFYFTVRDRPEDFGLSPIVEERLAVEAPPDTPAGQRRLVDLGWTPQVRRTIVAMGVAYFAFKFVRYALDSWTPMLIEESFGANSSVAGYLAALFDLAGFFGAIFAGWVTDRYFRGSRSLITFVMTIGMLGGVAFLSQWGAASEALFVVGVSIIGFMLFGPDSLLSGVGTVDVSSKRGAVVAAATVNGIGSLGPVVQEEVIGWLKTGAATTAEAIHGIVGLLLAVSAGGVVMTAMLLYWRRQGRNTL